MYVYIHIGSGIYLQTLGSVGGLVRCCKVVGHVFGCFRRGVVWFGVFVSIRQINADFNHFRAFYGYRWGSVCICGWIVDMGRKGRIRKGWEDETPAEGAII